MSHFEQRLEADLNHIRDWVWTLGENVEQALRNAKKMLVLRDEKMAYSVVLGDHPINRDSRTCDRLCHRFIARHLPGAGHLREMAATIRVNVCLERVGDYAVTICREALQLPGPIPARFAPDIDAIADEALHLLNQSRIAFKEGNADQAITLMQQARLIQSKMAGVYESLMNADDELDGVTMMVIFVMFNLFKRVADQAKNICDQTLYVVQGIAKLSRVHQVLFLDQAGSGIGQLAAAIGRKNYPEIANFTPATPGKADPVSPELAEFLASKGLPDEALVSEQLEALKHDLEGYSIIVSVNGPYSDYLPKIPFHSSGLNWNVDGGRDRTEQYRSLRSEIDGLMSLVAGTGKE